METAIVIAIVLAVLVVIFLSIYRWRKNMALLRTVTDTHRGTWSERKLILRLLKQNIPAITIYHDLYVERNRGQYSQIDAVVLTKVGIIVFEVKDYSGWIFGKGYQNYWTQVLSFGRRKYRFYNPVLQNNGHIESLKKRLAGKADVPFFSVIIFYGRCRLRNVSHIPNGTYIGYITDLKAIVELITESNPPAQYNDKLGVIETLRESVDNGDNPEIVHKHIQNVNNYIKYGL